jgi:hypothetical protein
MSVRFWPLAAIGEGPLSTQGGHPIFFKPLFRGGAQANY